MPTLLKKSAVKIKRRRLDAATPVSVGPSVSAFEMSLDAAAGKDVITQSMSYSASQTSQGKRMLTAILLTKSVVTTKRKRLDAATPVSVGSSSRLLK